MLTLYFSGQQIKSNSTISPNLTIAAPSVSWTPIPNTLYTLLLYNSITQKVHFAAVNIPNTDLGSSKILNGYEYLSSGSYTLDLYTQQEKLYGPLEIDTFKSKGQLISSITFDVKLSVKPISLIQPIATLAQHVDTSQDKETWFSPELSTDKAKFCRCVLQVGDKQPHTCNSEKAWFETRLNESGVQKKCYNPYAVCASRVGTTSRECGNMANFENIPDSLLESYASLNKIDIPSPYNRTQMLNNIYAAK